MKKSIAISLTLFIVFTLFTGCIDDIADEFVFPNRKEEDATKIPEESKIETAYPDEVFHSHQNTITVELAEEDLRRHSDHSALDTGILAFDQCTTEFPSLDDYHVTYWFKISVQTEYSTETYRATVTYHLEPINEMQYKFEYLSYDIWRD